MSKRRKGLTRDEKAKLRAELRIALTDAHRHTCELAELRDELRGDIDRIESLTDSVGFGADDLTEGLNPMINGLDKISEEI